MHQILKMTFLEKFSDLYLMKIHINFVTRKKFQIYIYGNYRSRNKLDLYLMKIEISFETKKFKSVFNENTNQF